MSEADGWNYGRCEIPNGGDARKFCTIDTSDGMTFVGVRIWISARQRWESNGEPVTGETVRAWRDMPEPAQGRFVRGKLLLPTSPGSNA